MAGDCLGSVPHRRGLGAAVAVQEEASDEHLVAVDEVCRRIWRLLCLLDTEPDFSRHSFLLQAVGNRLWQLPPLTPEYLFEIPNVHDSMLRRIRLSFSVLARLNLATISLIHPFSTSNTPGKSFSKDAILELFLLDRNGGSV